MFKGRRQQKALRHGAFPHTRHGRRERRRPDPAARAIDIDAGL